MNERKLTWEELTLDVTFLLERSMKAGSINFTRARDVGASSNSIVAIAYSRIPLERQELPRDGCDLEACELTWAKLPDHRKHDQAQAAMFNARRALKDKGTEEVLSTGKPFVPTPCSRLGCDGHMGKHTDKRGADYYKCSTCLREAGEGGKELTAEAIIEGMREREERR